MVVEILTAILVLVTAIYSYLTYRMAQASEASVRAVRDQSEAMLRPYLDVVVYVRPHTTLLYLRISNSGRTAAENVRLSIDKDFFQFGNQNRPEANLRKKPAFTQNIDRFAPGERLVFGLAQGAVVFGNEGSSDVTPQQFSVSVHYGFADKRVQETHKVDLRPYFGSEGERDPLVEEIERLRQVIERK
ncbi:MAG: hypothetical protein Q8K71_03900 [Polaromonas sp.]|nr:hypothetical protein [Polaromonas sp.]MDP3750493.1 hypothetical protein [Polaromonas sp.]